MTDERSSADDPFERWFCSNYLNPDGGSSHLPDWFKDDMRHAWEAARSASAAAWQPGQSVEARAHDLLDRELTNDPTQPTIAALRAVGVALQGELNARTALREIAAIGSKITDPNNTYGLQMTNVAQAAAGEQADAHRSDDRLERAERALAIISYMCCQSGEDAMKMRSIATDVTLWDRPDSMWWYGKDYGPSSAPAQPTEPLLTLDEIEATLRIEFNHSEDSASVRRAAERVWTFLQARAKTLARRATTSVLPRSESQAAECDGGLRPAVSQEQIKRLTANHKDVVTVKRRIEARLKIALAALQQVYTVCNENAAETCDARTALDVVRQVACDSFEQATSPVATVAPSREELAIEVMNVRRRIHGLNDLDLETLRRIKRDAGINEAFAIADALLALLAAKPAEEPK
jgi:hypothetical protein